MKEFFGIGGYQRAPEGFLSWQHLLFVGSLLVLMFVLSIWLGKRNRTIPPQAAEPSFGLLRNSDRQH